VFARQPTLSAEAFNHSLVRALHSLGHFQIHELSRGPRPSPTVKTWKKIAFTRVQDVFIEDAMIYCIA
jgi:hypothetical protein